MMKFRIAVIAVSCALLLCPANTFAADSDAPGSVRGRVLSIDGSPMASFPIRITFDFKSKRRHKPYGYETVTGKNGTFQVTDLPPDRYFIEFPDIPRNYYDTRVKIDNLIHAEEDRSASGRMDAPAREKRATELASKPWPLQPQVKMFEVKPGADVDLGTIRLERAPVLELQIVDEDGKPMPKCPFEVTNAVHDNFAGQTNEQGHARLNLVGYCRSGDAVVFIPYEMADKYNPKRLNRPLPREANMTDREIYERDGKTTWPGEQPWPEKFDDLTKQQRTKLHADNEKFRNGLKEHAQWVALLPEHPNYEVFTPKVGEVSKVRVVYKTDKAKLSTPRLFFREASTGRPIKYFTGVIQFEGGNVSGLLSHYDSAMKRLDKNCVAFRSADESGRVNVKLTLPDGIGEQEKRIEEEKKNPYSSERGRMPIRLFVDAPGYARRLFPLTSAQIRGNQELVFDLEPEARIVGRVIIGETSQPLNRDTLKAYLIRKEKWNEALERDYKYWRHMANVSNQYLEDGQRYSATKTYADMTSVEIGYDGRFEIRGLRPYEHWNFGVEGDEIPLYSRTDFTLKPGLNDLGTIRVGGEGQLYVQISDEHGQPIPGVQMEFPVGFSPVSFRDKKEVYPVSDINGRMAFGTRSLSIDRPVVKLIPPWGVGDLKNNPLFREHIWFSAVNEIDRTGDTIIKTRLAKGNTLTIEIARTSARDALFAAATKESDTFDTGRMPRKKGVFKVGGVYLEAVAPNPEGFIYDQVFAPDGGVAFNESTITIEVENVPPGRYKMSLEGYTYMNKSVDDYDRPVNGGEYYESKIVMAPAPEYPCVPLGYMDVEMTSGPTTVKMELSPINVELEANPTSPLMTPDAVVLMDRTEPKAMIGGSFLRGVVAGNLRVSSAATNDLMGPMVGYWGQFVKEKTVAITYAPIVFRAVPPGTYTIEAYQNHEALYVKPPHPIFKKTIVVKPDSGTMRVTVP